MSDNDDHYDEDVVDVILVVGKMKLYGHRRQLARKSPYFAAMFNSEMIESRSGIVHLQGVCPSAMHALMSYADTGLINVQPEAVPKLLEASTMLQFDDVVTHCVERLSDNLGTSNCLGFMNLADRFSLDDLHLQAKQVSMWYFTQVALESEILDLPLPYLVDYLSNDSLKLQTEIQVFQVVTRWIERNKLERLEHLEELISVVRFSDMTLKEIRNVSVNEVVKESPYVRSIVREIWMIRLGELSVERFGGSISPLSNISPAESVVDLVAAVEQNGSEPTSSTSSETSSTLGNSFKVEHVRKERVMAQRFLMAKPRCVPTVPAVVKFSDDKTRAPELIYFDPHDGRIKPITSITKVFQKNHVALGFKACAVGNFVVVVGGEFQHGRNNWNMAVWKYNIFSKTWTLLSNLRSPRRHHALCALDDFVYIIGGIGRFRVAVNTAEKICVTTGNLSNVASLPNPVYSGISVAHQGKIYVLDTNVYRYDPLMDVWSHMKSARLPHEMQLHSALAHLEGIYLVGTCPTELNLLNVDRLALVAAAATAASGTSSQSDKAAYVKIESFLHKSENACIANGKIYSFGNCEVANGLVVESYDLASGVVTIEYGCRNSCPYFEKSGDHPWTSTSSDVPLNADDASDVMVGAATVRYGCFALPKYFV